MNTHNRQQDAMMEFTHFLESKKMRKTSERFAILEKAIGMKAHFDVDDLYDVMERDGFHVSKQTIYSTLELLCESGMLRRHRFGREAARYEAYVENHCHLICTQCGKVKDVDDQELLKQFCNRKFSAFTPSYSLLYVYGLCSACMRHNKREARRLKEIGKHKLKPKKQNRQ